MTVKQNIHALNVVNTFKAKLPAETVEQVGESHLDELSLLIESAISAAVFDEMEKAANKADKLAHELRHFAEFFDRD